MREQLHHQRRNQSCSTECSHRKERLRPAHFSFKRKEGNAENKVCCREAAGRVSRKQRSPKTTVKRGSLEKLRRNPPSPVPASLTCLSTPSQHKQVGSCGQRLRLAPRHSSSWHLGPSRGPGGGRAAPVQTGGPAGGCRKDRPMARACAGPSGSASAGRGADPGWILLEPQPPERPRDQLSTTGWSRRRAELS